MGGNRFFTFHPFRSHNQAASYFDKQNSSLGTEAAVLKYPFSIVVGFISGYWLRVFILRSSRLRDAC
jgi:hypothetical protein